MRLGADPWLLMGRRRSPRLTCAAMPAIVEASVSVVATGGNANVPLLTGKTPGPMQRVHGNGLPCARQIKEDGEVSDDLTLRLAELAVRVGANLQVGQDVVVLAWDVEQAPLVRAVAECAYSHGARFVSAVYWDAHVKHSRLRHAPAGSLGAVPDWWEAITTECVERRSAVIHLHAPTPEVLQDIPLERAMRDAMPTTPRFWDAVDRGDLAWTVLPGVCPGLAQAILGTSELGRLWELLAVILRLDAPDPQSAWREHLARLRDRAALLQERNFTALRFRGGGTDLHVGLLAGARWVTVASGDPMGSTVCVQLAHRGGVHHTRLQADRGRSAGHAAHSARSCRPCGGVNSAV